MIEGVRRVRANGVDFAYVEQGPADGPLALCLHGFPDHALTWKDLMPALAEAGWRVVAPWLRGYHPTGPAPGGFYHVGALVADAVALHETLGGDDRAVVIGHDWGSIAAGGAAAVAPRIWRQVVLMAVPPLAVIVRGLRRQPQALRRAGYLFFLQVPVLPERWLRRTGVLQLHELWTPGDPHYLREEDFRTALEATFEHEQTVPAALAYYRSLFNPIARSRRYLRHEWAAFADLPPQPTLYLQGERDGSAWAQFFEATAHALPPRSRAELVAGTGHFLHLERPAEVNERVLDFLGAAGESDL